MVLSVIVSQVGASTDAGFALLYTDIATHVQLVFIFALFRGHGGRDTPLIAVATSLNNTRTVDLSSTPSLSRRADFTRDIGLTRPIGGPVFEREDAWTASVWSINSKATRTGSLCANVITEIETSIMGTISIARLPFLQADIPA